MTVAPACSFAAPVAGAKAKFPKTISGKFSGDNSEFTWEGSLSLKGKRKQTTYTYKGDAKYTWKLKKTTTSDGLCSFSPATGTITEKVRLAVNRTRSGKRGYSYSGGNGSGGSVGEIKRNCPGESPDASGITHITNAIVFGGFSKNLHTFGGKDQGFQWSFTGTR
ncbi:MAG: hypothetical protein WDZ37_01635 [Solirubrobacterales bacterium]